MNIDAEIEAAEKDWALIPNVEKDELPETTMAVKAHRLLADKIQLADEIAAECVRLGMTGIVTKENYSKAKTIKNLCVAARGNIKRNKEAANRDAIDWQAAINKRAKELTQAIESIEKPYHDGIKAIDDEKARLKAEKEAAELKAIEDAAREKLDRDRAEADAKRAAELEETRRLNAELNARLERERAEQDERDRVAAEALQAKQSEMERIERELAEFRRAKAAEERKEQDRLAAEAAKREAEAKARAEAARIEALKPDAEKLKVLGGRIAVFAGIFKNEVVAVAVETTEAAILAGWACDMLHRIAYDLDNFVTMEK